MDEFAKEVFGTQARPPALAVNEDRRICTTQRKEVRTVRRLPLLLAAGALWLFVAAVPALADGGPHVSAINNGTTNLTADSCAGCHRAHTAQGEYLLKAADENSLCLSCHGTASTGATTDVMTGVQYALASGLRDTGTQIGALRNGGFDQARVDTDSLARITYYRTASDLSQRPTVRAGTAVDVTSAHLALTENGIVPKDVAWGNGAAGSGAGPTGVELACVSCHNPHGNGQYRILNTLPHADNIEDAVSHTISGVSATTDRFTTATSHGFVVGDIVTISGVTGAAPAFSTGAQYVIKSAPTGNTFTVAAAPNKLPSDVTGATIDVTTSGTGGAVERYIAYVADAPLPDAGDTRNYSILQVRGYQGTADTYLLYASDVLAARTADAFGFVADIVGLTASNDRFTTGLAHGFAIGDAVTIAGGTPFDGARTILAIPSATTFTLTGVDVLANLTAGTGVGDKVGTAAKSVAGSFESLDGDYFHRTVPWDPRQVNSECTYDTFTDTSGGANPDYASACLTANDAPNGRPATVTGTSTVNAATITPSSYGQIAFNDQVSAWCSVCHSRYYSASNPNPGNEPGSSAQTVRSITAIDLGTDTITTSANHGYAVGDQVDFTAAPTAPDLSAGTWYVVWVGSSGTANQFRVSATYDGPVVDITGYSGGGTVVRLYPVSASSWWFPRPGEDIYKFQHQTTTNRSCVTCHVSHGSAAQMTGINSDTMTYPDGSAATVGNSRLLKVDNRGTCQACHDPTGTVTAGTILPSAPAPTVP